VRKIHYLSGAILIQNEGKADSLLYTYSDAQGSLIALTDANGSIVRRYAYDPWGARRDADNWNAKDNGDHLIVSRGYTGHEHLDAFGIINMNGHVYDPYTAQFFSPDTYVQAPGDWLNYNRYSYCSGNPFRYTDPSGNLQIGPFYISLNIGWSAQGGLSFGISAGVGLENVASVGISIGFGAKYSNFSFSVNGSIGGAYAYAGFDTKGGWMAGAGYSFISPFSVWSPVSINTNMFGVGLDYSENGGVSGNYMGMSINSGGISFNPSIGVSATLKYGTEVVYSDLSNDVTSRANSILKSQQEMIDYLASVNQGAGINGVESVDYENTVFPKKQTETRDADGIIHTKDGRIVSGVTYLHYRGFKITGSIYMSPHLSLGGFDVTFNHELIHIYHYNKYSGGKLINDKLKSYSEYVAHSYNQQYFPNEIAPIDFSGYGYSHTDIPSYLIPVSLPLIPQPSFWIK